MAIKFVKDEKLNQKPDQCDCCTHDSERWEGEELHVLEIKMGIYTQRVKLCTGHLRELQIATNTELSIWEDKQGGNA